MRSFQIDKKLRWKSELQSSTRATGVPGQSALEGPARIDSSCLPCVRRIESRRPPPPSLLLLLHHDWNGRHQENLKPMVRGVAFVSEQLGPPSVIADENIQVSVVIAVPDGCAPADAGNGKVRAKLVAYVLENAITPIAEHQFRFSVADVLMIKLNVVENVAVHHDNVARAVVIIIHEACAEAAVMPGGITELGGESRVFKAAVAQIAIKPRLLKIEMRHHNIQPAVAGGICRVGSHARFRGAVGADSDPGEITDLLKRSVMLVMEKEVGHGVIGDEDVLPAVLVVIKRHHTQTVAGFQSHP